MTDLTHEQIDEMEAGREIDYLIAKQIFDLDCLKDPPYGILIPVEVQVRNYSTDIFAAWEVVEKMEVHPDEILFSLVRKGGSMDTLHWAATFRECLGSHQYYYSEASTASLAICRAALKAVIGQD